MQTNTIGVKWQGCVCVCVCVCKPVHFSENKERDMKHQALKKTRLKRYFLTFILYIY